MNKKLPKFFKNKRNILILAFVLVVLGELIWATRFLSRPLPIPRLRRAVPTPEIAKTSLILSPTKGSFKKRETFEVEVRLETEKDISTDGVDVVLSFDPKVLAGIQIKNENFYPQLMMNSVDNKEGKIEFFALNPPGGSEIKGGGKIATITFKALKEGTAKLEFDFTPGSTKDSNVAQSGIGKDILTRVKNGEYLIE